MKNRIMRRVYFIYAVKLLMRPTALRFFLFMVLFLSTTAFVSFRNVFFNIPKVADPFPLYQFAVSAFAHAEVPLQLISIALFSIGLFLVSDIVKNWRGTEAFRVNQVRIS